MTVTEVQAENTIPKGKYTFIGVDIDTTGRRILDEVEFFSYFFFSLKYSYQIVIGLQTTCCRHELNQMNQNQQIN